MNPRIQWQGLLSLLLNHGEPRVVYRANFVVVTIPFLVEDRKRLLFITRLIGFAVYTRETSTRQAKRVRGQQAKSYAFISLLRLKESYLGKYNARRPSQEVNYLTFSSSLND